MNVGGKNNTHILVVGLSKTKNSLLSLHSTEDFKMTGSLELDSNLELSCVKRINDSLFLAGGNESLHLFELSSNGSGIKVIELNCFQTGDTIQTIVSNNMDFYAVTIKGQISILKLTLEKN